jgi:carbonic anhydrase
MKTHAVLALALASLTALTLPASAAAPAASAPTGGITRLMEGNARFAAGKPSGPNRSAERRQEVAAKQAPFAIVVSCSDSRVAPELVFDQGIGDLFVVRTAGHVVDPVALGSIEFAIGSLGARSILVVGHERCGAVQAALEHAEVPGSIGKVLESIEPAVGGPEKATPEALDRAARKQVQAVVAQLKAAGPIVASAIKDGSVEIACGVYDLDTGVVTAVESGASK